MSVQGILEDKSCLQQTLFDPLQRFSATYRTCSPLNADTLCSNILLGHYMSRCWSNEILAAVLGKQF